MKLFWNVLIKTTTSDSDRAGYSRQMRVVDTSSKIYSEVGK